MMRWVRWIAALVFLSPTLARAAPDYDPRNTAWNGLSELVAVAEAEGIPLVVVDTIDAETLGPRDALLVIYPRRRLPVASLLAFLRGGGRVALADDFGEGRTLLRRFAIERGAAPVDRAARLRDDAAFLVARARVAHPLTDGVDALVTNHPAALRHAELEPLFAYDDGPDALALSGSVGDGRFVAIADPSIFINEMLALEGNRRFAASLLRFLAADGGGRVVLVRGDARILGHHGDDPSAGPMERMNDLLAAAANADVPPLALTVAAVVLCGIFAAVASSSFSLRGPYGSETMLPPTRDPGATSEDARNLLHPTLMYKTELEAALATSLGFPEPPGVHALVDAMPSSLRPEARALLDELAALAGDAGVRRPARRVRPRAFVRYHRRGEALLAAVRKGRSAR